MQIVEFKREALENLGFNGFVTFDRMQNINPPDSPGVYVIYREKEGEPTFLEKNTGGLFKGNDPTVELSVLEEKWVSEASVVYIGKATNLRKRLSQYRRFGAGEPIGHWGGRYIWQCADVNDFLVAWMPTQESPREVEKILLSLFVDSYGRPPFANLQ
jgi:hypothetical protein